MPFPLLLTQVPSPHPIHPSSLQSMMGPQLGPLSYQGPDPNPRARAAWRLSELEAHRYIPHMGLQGTDEPGIGSYPPWLAAAAALRSYLAG